MKVVEAKKLIEARDLLEKTLEGKLHLNNLAKVKEILDELLESSSYLVDSYKEGGIH